MRRETSSIVSKRFGEFARLAQHEPVEVTTHDQPYVVILSAQEHARLRRLDRQVMASAELPSDLCAAIEDAQPSETSKGFNAEVDS